MQAGIPCSLALMRSTDEMTVSLYFSSVVKTGMFLDTTLSMS